MVQDEPPITLASLGTAPPHNAFVKPPAKRRLDFTQKSAEIDRMLREMRDDTTNYDTSVYWCAAVLHGRLGSLPNMPIIHDSGAALSAICKKFYNDKFLDMALEPWSMAPVTVGNGNHTSPLGRLLLPVTIGNKRHAIRFAVIDGLPHNALLGVDFLRISRAVVDYDEGWMSFKDTSGELGSKIPVTIERGSRRVRTSELVLSDGATIEPYSGKTFDVNDPAPRRRWNGSMFIQPHPVTSIKLGAYTGQGVVSMHLGKTIAFITNMTAKPLYLPKGTPVALFEPFNSADFNLVALDVIGDLENKLAQTIPTSTAPKPERLPRNLAAIRSLIEAESSTVTYVPTAPIPDLDFTQVAGLSLQETNFLTRHFHERYRDIFSDGSTPGYVPNVVYHIDTGTHRPLTTRPPRMAYRERPEMTSAMKEMLANQIVRPSNSPWAAPVVLVPKKDGKIRFCVDYRKLNAITRRDSYPLPRIDDALNSLQGASYISSFDVTWGYWNIKIAEQDIPKTAFITPDGLYEFVRMPFGLTNAPATFQRLMDSILAGVKWMSCLVYMDDIIVLSPTFAQHVLDIDEVFHRIREAGLKLRARKCTLCRAETEYLGHVVTNDGRILMDPKKVAAVKAFPTPKSVEDVYSFLGLAGYYRHFVAVFADISWPLWQLTRKNGEWQWTDAHQFAFDTLKDSLTSEPVLRRPDFSRPFLVQTDASGRSISGILAQKDDAGQEYVVAYSSRGLLDAERKWDVREREALAIIWTCESFRAYLYGAPFEVWSDHQSLQWLLTSTAPGRLTRWALRLAEFDFVLKYRPRARNMNADSLTHHDLPPPDVTTDFEPHVLMPMVDFDATAYQEGFAKDQRLDPELKPLIDYLTAGTAPTDSNIRVQAVAALHTLVGPFGLLVRHAEIKRGERAVKVTQICVPASRTEEILGFNHESVTSGHIGGGKLWERLRERFCWSNMSRDSRRWVAACVTCQSRKPPKPADPGHLHAFDLDAINPGDDVSIDILGPFPVTDR